MRRKNCWPGVMGWCCGFALVLAHAQTPPADESGELPQESLASRQEAIVLRYQRFEATLLQLAEYLRKTDPDRAELLVRALGKSKETRIPDQLRQIVELLQKDQLGDAIDSQDHVLAQMQLVLLLLQSEDRKDELEREKQRIQGLIKAVEKIIGKETDVRAATERRAPAEALGKQQRGVAEDTEKLIEQIDAQDRARQTQSAERNGSSGSANAPNKSDSSKPQGESSAPKPPAGDTPPREGTEPSPGTPSPQAPQNTPPSGQSPTPSSPAPGNPSSTPPSPKSSPSPSQSPSAPSPATPGDSPSPSGDSPSAPSDPQSRPPQDQAGSPSTPPATPGREDLEQARREMERAIRELEQQQHGKASDHQDQALAELHKAKEKLEEILRQLREEEKELMLAALEARFRDMLARQVNVYNGTVGLATVPEAHRGDKHRSRAIELSRQQDEIALLAAKSLTLLKEEGSSIAFPEAVMQLREDMLTSARRLERAEVGEITQAIQKDIIEALEEILDALQKELEKTKDRKQQPQPQQPQQPGDQPLVDALAELKMLRSLQFRVNRRTRQLGRLVEGEQAQDPEVIQQLQQLSVRQAKIQQTTADLAAGRNR